MTSGTFFFLPKKIFFSKKQLVLDQKKKKKFFLKKKNNNKKKKKKKKIEAQKLNVENTGNQVQITSLGTNQDSVYQKPTLKKKNTIKGLFYFLFFL
mgnify:CR=1 FL=1